MAKNKIHLQIFVLFCSLILVLPLISSIKSQNSKNNQDFSDIILESSLVSSSQTINSTPQKTKWIIKFKDAPTARYESDLDNEISGKEKQTQNLLRKKGKTKDDTHKISALRSEVDSLKNNKESKISIHKSKIDDVHKQSLTDIKNIKSSSRLSKIKEYKTVFNGVAIDATKEEADEISKLGYVESVQEDKTVSIALYDSVPLIGADQVWNLTDEYGRNITGKNITIAILDTGVDYTHQDLGNCSITPNIPKNGNNISYSLESAHPYADSFNYTWTINYTGLTNIAVHFSNISTEEGWDYIYVMDQNNNTVSTFSGISSNVWSNSVTGDIIKIKFVTDSNTHDFGFSIDYVLNGTVSREFENCSKVIDGYDFVNSDNNPMDDHGHGTHVASTAAGNGVLKGVAPDAKIIAYKVLDSSGSGVWSDIISAIEKATDPNLDGNTSDHYDIISMSLGGSGDPDDEISLAVDNAVDSGVIAVIAAGNSGPGSATIGSPGTSRKAITVGASNNNIQRVSILYANNTFIESNALSRSSLSTNLYVELKNVSGYGYSQNFTDSGNFNGKIALIQRGDLTFTDKIQNAYIAGAVGVIVYNNAPGIFSGVLLNYSAIPGISISQENGTYLLNLLSNGTVWINITVYKNSSYANEMADFSSRGPVTWGSKKIIKPDITAPGVSICAAEWANAWSDSRCIDSMHVSISGTSMATPHVAGLIALIKQKNPTWTPQEIKNALKNTAVNLGYDHNTQGYGRVNATAVITLTEKPPVATLDAIDYSRTTFNISGSASASSFTNYSLYYGVGTEPSTFFLISISNQSVANGNLYANFNSLTLPNATYTIKLITNTTNNVVSEDRVLIIVNTTTTPPYFITNNTLNLEYYYPLNYDINATGTNNINMIYSINNSNFNINSSSGVITNTSLLSLGNYSMQLNVTDTVNVNSTTFTIIVADTLNPNFSEAVQNQYLEYNSNFYYDINATDQNGRITSSIVYTINNSTNFTINQSTGMITNISFLELGNFPLTIFINDTRNHISNQSFTIFVNDTILPHFTNLSIIHYVEFGNNFYYDVNGTDNYPSLATYSINSSIFTINQTTGVIVNNSYLNIGMYSLNLTITDYSNNRNSSIITINVSDTIAPIINDTKTNLTISFGSDGGIFLMWNNDTQVEQFSYNLYKTNSNIFTLPLNISLKILSNTTLLNYTDNSSKEKNLTYFYVLTETDSHGNENLSAITAVLNLTTPLDCSNDYDILGSFSACVSGSKSRTNTRICYILNGTTTNPIPETASCTSGGSSGGSPGGSSGAATGSASELSSISSTLPELKSDTPTSVSIDNSATGLYEAEVNVAENIQNIKFTFSKIDTLPEGTSSPKESEKVFKYIEIKMSSDKDKVKQANLKFKIEKTWITQNNIDKNNVRLFRFTKQWDELLTKVTNEDQTYVYMEAETPGFSFFKISTIQTNQSIHQKNTEDEKTPNVSLPQNIIIKPESEENKNETMFVKNTSLKNNLFQKNKSYTSIFIILSILISSGIIFFIVEKHKHTIVKSIINEERYSKILDSFFEKAREHGVSAEIVKQKLLDKGWNRERVLEAYNKAKTISQAAKEPEKAQEPEKTDAESKKLRHKLLHKLMPHRKRIK